MKKIALLIFLLAFVVFISGCTKIKDCGTDLKCFKESAKTCSKSKVNLIDEGNNLRITVRGHSVNFCKVSFKIENLGDDLKIKYPTETKIAIGKTMNCNINKKYVDLKELNYIDEIINLPNEFDEHCSGPIKDLMQGPFKEIITKEFKTMINEENLI